MMNGQEFLEKMPKLPDEAAYRSQWVPLEDFLEKIGDILHEQRTFVGNTGGGDDPDTFRGFGATSQTWKIPTQHGWEVLLMDNPNFGYGILHALSPEGATWVWKTVGWTYKEWFVEDALNRRYEQEKEDALQARALYLAPAEYGLEDAHWWLVAPKISTKYPGYFVQNGWICQEGQVHEGGEPVRLARLFENGVVGEWHSSLIAPPDWWKKGMSFEDLFF